MSWAKKAFFYLLLGLLPFAPFGAEQRTTARQFDEQAMEAYKADSNFDYTAEYAKAGSFFRDLFLALFAMIADFFNSQNPGLGKNIFMLILAGVFIGGLILMIRIRYGGVITSEKTYAPMVGSHFSTEENADYHQLLRNAVQEKNTKLSVRYLYLLSIHNLYKQGKIKLSIWKTAMDYLHETPKEEQEAFSKIIRLFEACWYGDYEPDEQEFDSILTLAKRASLA